MVANILIRLVGDEWDSERDDCEDCDDDKEDRHIDLGIKLVLFRYYFSKDSVYFPYFDKV